MELRSEWRFWSPWQMASCVSSPRPEMISSQCLRASLQFSRCSSFSAAETVAPKAARAHAVKTAKVEGKGESKADAKAEKPALRKGEPEGRKP